MIISFKIIHFHRYIHYIGLVGNRRLITDVGSNPKLVTFFFIGEPILFIILEL